MKRNKKGLILSVLGILGLIVITAGVTYAFFNYIKQGTTENTVTTGTITFLYTEVSGIGRGISINDAYPISDEVGKVQTGEGNVFDFKVTSTTPTNSSIPYEVTARKKTDSTLDDSAVKLYLTKVSGNNEEEVLLAKYNDLVQTSKVEASKYTEKTIYTGKVPSNSNNYEQAFRLRMWIDESIDFSQNEDGTYPYNGKTFTVTVNVYADAKVVTEEDKALESNNEITSIQVGNKKAVEAYSDSYDYEIGLDSGTTSTSLNIETESLDTTVKVESLDSLAYSSSIKRLSATKNISVTEGDNYFKITTTSLTGEEKTSIINVRVGKYKESILNEVDPVLSDNLVPVIITDDGKVQKIDTNYTWYDYETKNWANAVVLKDTSISYSIGEIIPEENIESYFVWIPKYSYQLWDLGKYTSATSVANKAHAIPIRFGLTNTSDSNTGECTTPGTAGTNGSCVVGDYMTHPAFLAFDSTGFWVGKFETGYDGATTATDAQQDTFNISKIVVKPNVYSWRGTTTGNAFKNSYEYLRNDESHMMKNTEWGAVAYLSHSIYGTCTETTCSQVRINNNSAFITGYAATVEPTIGFTETSLEGNRLESTSLNQDGTHTKMYNTKVGHLASTTGNITGIYDTNGGAWDCVMGYTTGSSIGVGGESGITSLYSDFYTNNKWNKYYDKYSSTSTLDYNNRILGDATGEMGPFNYSSDGADSGMRYHTSWYLGYAYQAYKLKPWFFRGGMYNFGYEGSNFSFWSTPGDESYGRSYRIVLTPTK